VNHWKVNREKGEIPKGEGKATQTRIGEGEKNSRVKRNVSMKGIDRSGDLRFIPYSPEKRFSTSRVKGGDERLRPAKKLKHRGVIRTGYAWEKEKMIWKEWSLGRLMSFVLRGDAQLDGGGSDSKGEKRPQKPPTRQKKKKAPPPQETTKKNKNHKKKQKKGIY